MEDIQRARHTIKAPNPPAPPRVKRARATWGGSLRDRTPQQKAQHQAASAAARREAVAAARLMQQDWDDAQTWRAMAAERGIQLPAYFLPCKPAKVRSCLRKLNVSVSEFGVLGGCADLEVFASANPRLPLWALFGFLLEYTSERDAAARLLRSRLATWKPQ